jgi:peroxiredoxin
MPRPSSTLRLGDPAPGFTLTDAESGDPVALADLLRGRAGALLVFHRGLW